MPIALCQNNECKYSKTCDRFLTKEGVVLNFPAICNEENKYERYIKTEVDIIKKDEDK